MRLIFLPLIVACASWSAHADDEIAPYDDDEIVPVDDDEIAPLIEDDEIAPVGDDEIAPISDDAEDAPVADEGQGAEAPAPNSSGPVDAAAPRAPAADAATSTSSTDTSSAAESAADDDGDSKNIIDGTIADLSRSWRVGDATPLSRRSPLPKQFTIEADLHYGLVGTGPTRFTNDIRFGIFDWWEIRTTLTPYPAALMSRFMLGSQDGLLGAFLFEGGLAAWDAGLRLVTDETEPEVGVRFHFEAAVAYSRAIGERLSVWGEARVRYRYSMLSEDEQNAVAGTIQLTYDLIKNLSVTGGLGYAEVIGSPVRELSINFTETDRPGMAHFLLRNDGWSRSVTVPLAITYGRIDSFDVDVFVTPRVYPQFDILFGAGIRWRINPVDVVTGWMS
jgi:hypothetical protein